MSYGHSAQADLKSYKILHIILFLELFLNYVWPTIDAMISVLSINMHYLAHC